MYELGKARVAVTSACNECSGKHERIKPSGVHAENFTPAALKCYLMCYQALSLCSSKLLKNLTHKQLKHATRSDSYTLTH